MATVCGVVLSSCRLLRFQPTRNPAPPRPLSTWRVESLASSGRGRRIRVGLADFITYYRIGEHRLSGSGTRAGRGCVSGGGEAKPPATLHLILQLMAGSGAWGAGEWGRPCVEGRVGWCSRRTRVPGAPSESRAKNEPGPGTIGISSCSEERRGWDPAHASFSPRFAGFPLFPSFHVSRRALAPGRKAAGAATAGYLGRATTERTVPRIPGEYRGPVSGEGGPPRRSEARKGWLGFATG